MDGIGLAEDSSAPRQEDLTPAGVTSLALGCRADNCTSGGDLLLAAADGRRVALWGVREQAALCAAALQI